MSITIDLDEEQLESLELMAKDKNKDVSHFIAEIIDDYFEKLFDEELIKIADERYAKILSGESKTIPFEEVLRENGLSDWIKRWG